MEKPRDRAKFNFVNELARSATFHFIIPPMRPAAFYISQNPSPSPNSTRF